MAFTQRHIRHLRLVVAAFSLVVVPASALASQATRAPHVQTSETVTDADSPREDRERDHGPVIELPTMSDPVLDPNTQPEPVPTPEAPPPADLPEGAMYFEALGDHSTFTVLTLVGLGGVLVFAFPLYLLLRPRRRQQ